jgi:hypothetical protein
MLSASVTGSATYPCALDRARCHAHSVLDDLWQTVPKNWIGLLATYLITAWCLKSDHHPVITLGFLLVAFHLGAVATRDRKWLLHFGVATMSLVFVGLVFGKEPTTPWNPPNVLPVDQLSERWWTVGLLAVVTIATFCLGVVRTAKD